MKRLYYLLITACLFMAPAVLFGQEDAPESNLVQLNSIFSYQMMEHNQDLRKVDILIDAKSNDRLPKSGLIFGASITSIMDYQKSNRNSKFGWLMRHPTSANQIGETVSEAVIHAANLSVTGSVNNWLTAYAELLYDPQQSFGMGTITALTRNQIQLRKGMILVGNLNKFPLYFALGKMDTPFGQTGSVSPFTNSTMWHAFGGLGYGAILGFKKSGLNISLNAIQGGSQFRALHTPVDSTNVPSRLNNFSADLNYTIQLSTQSNIKLGASYLHGSAYCQPYPVQHFMPCDDNNPAMTFYGKVSLGDKFVLKGSFATTTDEWPGTHNPNPPLNEFPAEKVTSLDIGAKYAIISKGNVVYCISGEFSNFRAGPDGAPWERQNQIVLGLNGIVKNSSRLFLEIFRTEGYVPLNWISGGNLPDPGATHSERDATSTGIVVGALLTL